MTQEQAICWFASEVLDEPVTTTRRILWEGFNFGINIFNTTPRLVIPKDLNCKHDEDDQAFRKNFVTRCPLARGFSAVTTSILHECGHWATRSLMDITVYKQMKNEASSQEQYMKIPWEHLATDWAICWLYSPKNRKLAKEFERKYFKYGNYKENLQH